MEEHVVSTTAAAPVNNPNSEIVIFRSSRKPHRHDHVLRGQIVALVAGRKVLAKGSAVVGSEIVPFREIKDQDVQDGYFLGATQSKESLLACLRTMYTKRNGSPNYEWDTPTVVLRIRRLSS